MMPISHWRIALIREHADAAIENIEGKELAVVLHDGVDAMLLVTNSECVIGGPPRGLRVSACWPRKRSGSPSRSFPGLRSQWRVLSCPAGKCWCCLVCRRHRPRRKRPEDERKPAEALSALTLSRRAGEPFLAQREPVSPSIIAAAAAPR